jgi:hypothetical protein
MPAPRTHDARSEAHARPRALARDSAGSGPQATRLAAQHARARRASLLAGAAAAAAAAALLLLLLRTRRSLRTGLLGANN